MKVLKISLPPFMTNCYICYENEGGECFIIDPASNAEEIIKCIAELDLIPKAILLTHGHFDHIGASDKLREKFNIPLYIHEADEKMLSSPHLNCSQQLIDVSVKIKKSDKLLKDGDKLHLGNSSLEAIHTPGHSEGSCIFVADDCIFTGDTIFKDNYGRYDLPGGNFELLKKSIFKIISYTKDYILYPGHNEVTKISYERKNYCIK